MELEFIRYRYLQQETMWYRFINCFLPKRWMKKYCFHRKWWKREEDREGEFHGLIITLQCKKEFVDKIGAKEVFQCLELDIMEQKRAYPNSAILLEGELYRCYENVESTRTCYPYHYHIEHEEPMMENRGCLLFAKKRYIDWLKFFFLEEITEYYRMLYGIQKKKLVIEIIADESEIEETKRVIKLLAKDLNYMVVKTNHKEEYEEISGEIYEDTGLSILFMEQSKTEESGEELAQIQRLALGDAIYRHTTVVIDIKNLFPKASILRITQHGIWLDQEIITAVLMERVINFDGTILEEELTLCKRQYFLSLRKIM